MLSRGLELTRAVEDRVSRRAPFACGCGAPLAWGECVLCDGAGPPRVAVVTERLEERHYAGRLHVRDDRRSREGRVLRPGRRLALRREQARRYRLRHPEARARYRSRRAAHDRAYRERNIEAVRERDRVRDRARRRKT